MDRTLTEYDFDYYIFDKNFGLYSDSGAASGSGFDDESKGLGNGIDDGSDSESGQGYSLSCDEDVCSGACGNCGDGGGGGLGSGFFKGNGWG